MTRQREKAFLSIGEIATRSNLTVSAIRYYADEGLIHAVRSGGGTRNFARGELRRVSFIAIAQRLGFSLKQIRAQLARLPDDRPPTKKDWARISREFRRDIDERIAALERLRNKLDGCIGCGCLSLEACAIYNADDRAGDLGAGTNWVEQEPPD
ncbi:MAG: redox-sensitive transcriptional activator SoxR [Pseudomonadota bacterium]